MRPRAVEPRQTRALLHEGTAGLIQARYHPRCHPRYHLRIQLHIQPPAAAPKRQLDTVQPVHEAASW